MPASAKGSEHYIQLDRLELLETKVLLFIGALKGTEGTGALNGRTE